MNFLDRHGATSAAMVGGFVAVYSVLVSPGNDGLIAESLGVWYSQFVSPQWAGSVAVVAAVLTLIGLQVRKSPKLVAVVAVLSVIVIGLPSVVDITGSQAVSINAVGAGLMLGSAALIAVNHRRAQLCLGLGIIAALLFEGALDAKFHAGDARWTVVTGGPQTVNSTVPIVVLVVVAALLATVAWRTAPGTDQLDALSAIVLLALPFGFLLVYAYLGSYNSTTTMWVLAVVIALGFVLAASRLVDGRDGNILLVGFAIAAASVSGLGWGLTSWWVALAGLSALIGGAYLGTRRPTVRLWIGLLAAVAASGLFTGNSWLDAVPTVAYALVFPFAAGAAVASCMSVGVGASVVGPAVPLAMTLFSATAPAPPPELAWSVDLSDDVMLPTVVYSPLFVGVVIATVAIVAVGAACQPFARESFGRAGDV